SGGSDAGPDEARPEVAGNLQPAPAGRGEIDHQVAVQVLLMNPLNFAWQVGRPRNRIGALRRRQPAVRSRGTVRVVPNVVDLVEERAGLGIILDKVAVIIISADGSGCLPAEEVREGVEVGLVTA